MAGFWLAGKDTYPCMQFGSSELKQLHRLPACTQHFILQLLLFPPPFEAALGLEFSLIQLLDVLFISML